MFHTLNPQAIGECLFYLREQFPDVPLSILADRELPRYQIPRYGDNMTDETSEGPTDAGEGNTEADRPTDPDASKGAPDGAEAGPTDVSGAAGEGGDEVDPNPPDSADNDS